MPSLPQVRYPEPGPGPVPPAWPPQQQGHAQPPMHVWGTAVVPQPLFVGGFKDAIFHGAGLLNPRISGLGYLAAGALCGAGTYALIHLIGIIFVYPAALTTGLGLPGLFMLLTGEPKARPGDVSQPLIVRIGLVLSFMVGQHPGALHAAVLHVKKALCHSGTARRVEAPVALDSGPTVNIPPSTNL